jgi:hypothetical protein
MSRRPWTNKIAFLRTHSLTTTRQGYGQMLAWMRSLGDLQRIGVEIDRQLWGWPPAVFAARQRCRARGHDPDKQDRRRRADGGCATTYATCPHATHPDVDLMAVDAMISGIVDELAPNLVVRNSIWQTGAAPLS